MILGPKDRAGFIEAPVTAPLKKIGIIKERIGILDVFRIYDLEISQQAWVVLPNPEVPGKLASESGNQPNFAVQHFQDYWSDSKSKTPEALTLHKHPTLGLIQLQGVLIH